MDIYENLCFSLCFENLRNVLMCALKSHLKRCSIHWGGVTLYNFYSSVTVKFLRNIRNVARR